MTELLALPLRKNPASLQIDTFAFTFSSLQSICELVPEPELWTEVSLTTSSRYLTKAPAPSPPERSRATHQICKPRIRKPGPPPLTATDHRTPMACSVSCGPIRGWTHIILFQVELPNAYPQAYTLSLAPGKTSVNLSRVLCRLSIYFSVKGSIMEQTKWSEGLQGKV